MITLVKMLLCSLCALPAVVHWQRSSGQLLDTSFVVTPAPELTPAWSQAAIPTTDQRRGVGWTRADGLSELNEHSWWFGLLNKNAERNDCRIVSGALKLQNIPTCTQSCLSSSNCISLFKERQYLHLQMLLQVDTCNRALKRQYWVTVSV